MKQLVLASGNAGKLREFQTLLTPLDWAVVPQSALNVSEAAEPHPTFVENALAKARHAAQHTGLAALADDSGICVDALGGAPGIHSARFAGEPKSDERNNAELIARLAGQPNRRAHYMCVLVFVRHAADPEPLIAEGRWHGEIIDQARGAGGFGYDPYFWLPEFQCTAAELSASDKHRVSHRGLACQHLLTALRQYYV